MSLFSEFSAASMVDRVCSDSSVLSIMWRAYMKRGSRNWITALIHSWIVAPVAQARPLFQRHGFTLSSYNTDPSFVAKETTLESWQLILFKYPHDLLYPQTGSAVISQLLWIFGTYKLCQTTMSKKLKFSSTVCFFFWCDFTATSKYKPFLHPASFGAFVMCVEYDSALFCSKGQCKAVQYIWHL